MSAVGILRASITDDGHNETKGVALIQATGTQWFGTGSRVSFNLDK